MRAQVVQRQRHARHHGGRDPLAHFVVGDPATATSLTAGWVRIASSTSVGPNFSPRG
ncbi:hypothetical protein I552_6517 [Mycobacterium xenopi 3993]|nr:hypothetical protein I552_6517 [Mycobacterium xenopi 3993]